MGYVGLRLRRTEGPRLVQGAGQFIDDLRLSGVLYAGFVRSPYAHARILVVDTSAASALEGVVEVYAHADLPELAEPVPATEISSSLEGHRLYPLARDVVRYAGEPVVVVLCEDPYLLEDAIEAVTVEYDPMPVVTDAERALAGGALVWEDAPGNMADRVTLGCGDIREAFRSGAVVIEERFAFPRSAGAAMEPRAVAAAPGVEIGPKVIIWDATQIPHGVRDQISRYLGLDPVDVQVITPDVGGGFGVKARIYQEEYIVPVLALRHQRPVRFVATRTEDLMTTCHGRGQIHRARLAARADGTILGLEDHIVQDIGAYVPNGANLPLNGAQVPLNSARHLMGPYRVPAVDVEITCVYTNRVMTSPLRGGGRPQGVYVMERLLDRLAAHLDLDRAEIRRRNFIPPDAFPYDTGFPGMSGGTVTYDSGDYPAYLSHALEAIGYDSFQSKQKEARLRGQYLGLGLAAFTESTGLGSEDAHIEVEESGIVTVRVGSPSQGQGHATTFAQMVSDRLGTTIESVYVTSTDTASGVSGAGTIASRMGQYGGNAVSLAAQSLREKALTIASDVLEIAPQDLELQDSWVSVKGLPGRGMSLAEVAKEARRRGGALSHSHSFAPERGATYAGGVNVAIVDVDIETGNVCILRYLVVHDSGTIINPMVVEGQVHGGVIHGLGNALYEECLYGDDGQLHTATFADYSVPSIGEVPFIDIIHLETPSPFNPEGIKGAGEGGTIAAIPTIVSAVEDALVPFGIQLNDVPLRAAELVQLVGQDPISSTRIVQ